MRGAHQVGCPKGCKSFKGLALILGSCLLLAAPSFGQTRFGQTRGGGYPLPSVSSMGGYPLPSVSSIPNTGFGNRFHNGAGFNRGAGFNHGGRYRGGGYAYGVPYYYIPLGGYDYGYDSDYVGDPNTYSGPSTVYSGGPNMYSGPPMGANESTLHIIVEQAPAQSYRPPTDDAQAEVAPPPPVAHEQSSTAREATPREPTVLVFRDGHQQEVGNYAIMGQTVYVLDDRTRKISLADLDVPATVKANDDRGMEFKVPAQKPAPKKADIELKVPAEPQATNPSNIASALP
ncbi:MAG: hypothetical protein ABSD63_04595 [Candidatus Korobacteraceae bacterium]